jgi:hypothetical protein
MFDFVAKYPKDIEIKSIKLSYFLPEKIGMVFLDQDVMTSLSKIYLFVCKGHLILRCHFGVIKSSKTTTKNLQGYLP